MFQTTNQLWMRHHDSWLNPNIIPTMLSSPENRIVPPNITSQLSMAKNKTRNGTETISHGLCTDCQIVSSYILANLKPSLQVFPVDMFLPPKNDDRFSVQWKMLYPPVMKHGKKSSIYDMLKIIFQLRAPFSSGIFHPRLMTAEGTPHFPWWALGGDWRGRIRSRKLQHRTYNHDR